MINKVPNVNKLLRMNGVQRFIETLFMNHLSDVFAYHTLNVKEAAMNIANGSDCSEEEIKLLTIAALFHQTGCTWGVDKFNENSQLIAFDYLIENGWDNEIISRIIALINIANTKGSPTTKLERIMCDATTAYFGERKLVDRLKMEYLENKIMEPREVSLVEWLRIWKEKLIQHSYFMPISWQMYGSRKTKNIIKIDAKLTKLSFSKSTKQIKAKEELIGPEGLPLLLPLLPGFKLLFKHFK